MFIGGAFGGISAYMASNGNISTAQLVQATLIGAGAGAAGIGLTSGLIGMGIGNRAFLNTPVIGNTLESINSLINRQAAGVMAGSISAGLMSSFSDNYFSGNKNYAKSSSGLNPDNYSFDNYTL